MQKLLTVTDFHKTWWKDVT